MDNNLDNDLEFYKLVHETVNEAILEYFSDSHEIVTHYTSPQGFLSIIQNKSLWFGNVLCVNDLTEVKYAFDEIISPCIQQYPFAHETLKQRILNKMPHHGDYKFSFVHKNEIKYCKASIFVFSTCLNNNSTMLWNMYCKSNGNQGFAINFAKDKFLKNIYDVAQSTHKAAVPGFYLMEGKVIYDREKQIEIVNNFLDRIEDKIDEQVSEDVIGKLLEIFLQKFLILALFMKDADFDKEQEYRYLVICDEDCLDTNSNNPPYLTFIPQNGNIVSRLVVPYTVDLIMGVTISPYNQDAKAKETTDYFLRKHGISILPYSSNLKMRI